MATFNPKYAPQGDNNARNPYFKKINNVKLSKRDETRRRFAGEVEPVEPELPVTGKLWIGDYDDTSVTVTAVQIAGADEVRLVAVPVNSGATIMSPPLAVEPTYRYARATLAGLKPGSEYIIRLRSMGGANSSEPGWVKTRPATRQAFKLGLGTCGERTRNHPIYDTIWAQNPDMQAFMWLDDRGYFDITTNNVALYHQYDDQIFNQSRQASFHRRPVINIWGDHDYGADNSNANSAVRPAALSWFRNRVPARPHLTGPNDPIYRAWSPMPGVKVALIDNRSDRYSTSAMIGAAQEAWLIGLFQDLEPDEILLFSTGVPWISSGDNDTWHGAAAQRQRIGDAIQQYAPGRVYGIAGDMHALAYDDGRNSVGGFPVAHAAPLGRATSIKGGPYSAGTPIRATEQQYGVLQLTPITGGWTVVFTGYSVDSVGVQTQRITATATLVAPAQVAPAFEGTSTIIGQTVEGATLTADPGPFSGTPTPTPAYQWRMDGVDVAGATGPTFVRPAGTGGVPSVVITLDNDVEPNATRTVTAEATTAAEPAPAKVFGTVRQFAMFKFAPLGDDTQVNAASGSFAAAPQPGNLLIALAGVDKNSGAFAVPSGWTMIDKHQGTTRAEVSGMVLYRIADGTETGPITVTWANLRRAALNLIEVEGTFGPTPVIGQGANKTEANATSVALTTGTTIPSAPAFALGWMTNDTAGRASQTNIAATNGFAVRGGNPTPGGTDGQPVMIVATKTVTAPEVVSTTISHGAAADGTIGFLAVFEGA